MAMLGPLTAREALLEICRLADWAISHGPVTLKTVREIEEMARAGLDRRGMENFELSDQLADRLADAHRALRLVVDYLYGRVEDGDSTIEGEVREALALPPDLEEMIERRIGPPR